MKYTFTFPSTEERTINSILSNMLEGEEYTIVEPIRLVDETKPRGDRCAVFDVPHEGSITIFKLSTRHLDVKRERTEEELKALQEQEDRHKVKVTVYTG